MVRVVLFLIVVGAVGASLAWLADRPGDVVFVWQGYQVETSVMALAIALVVFAVVVVILWQIYRLIVGGPRAIGHFFRERREMRGYRALSGGMIALGAGDAGAAGRQAQTARKLLRDEPLTGLLTAQAAQLKGNHDGAAKAFAEMLKRPETELLGLHGLFVEAQRVGDTTAAELYAEEAVKRAPSLGWAAVAALRARTRAGDWKGALDCLERNRRNNVVDKATGDRHRAVLLTAVALEAEDTAPDEALQAGLEAHKLAPDLVPAAVVTGRVASQLGKFSKATQVLERTWRKSPHPDIADVYTFLRAGDSTRDRLERAKTLHRKLSHASEGRIAVARAAIEARDFAEARSALKPELADNPRRGICLMMAEIENEETGDAGRVREWLARALRAPRDPAWVADGHVADSWAPAAPLTGRLDAYVWTVPDDESSGVTAAVLDAAVAEATGIDRTAAAPMIDVKPAAERKPEVAGKLPQDSRTVEKPESPQPRRDAKPAAPTGAAVAAPEPEAAAPSEAGAAEADSATGVAPEREERKAPQEPAPAASIASETEGPARPPVETTVKADVADAANDDVAAADPAVEQEPAKPEPAKAGDATPTGTVEADVAASSDKPASTKHGDKEEALAPAFTRAPDDPGPDPDPETDEQPRRRFGLF